ncbi:MAG: nucleoside triphosphate pyrophosphatase [Opitutaceae bacterium]
MVAADRLILASGSPRRRELLDSLGLPFEVVTAEVDEADHRFGDPRKLVLDNARLKADWVSRHYPDRVVLGADTTVFLDGRILNKPADLAESRAMLARLSGRTHTVFTGIVLLRQHPPLEDSIIVASDVRFRVLDQAGIEDYIARVNTLDKAGAYAIQEEGERIVESHSGSLSNIIGLPLEETKALLTRHRFLP